MLRMILRRMRGPRDRGIALPVALGLGMVMLVLVAGGMAVATNGVTKTDTDENWQGALSAAYAGVSEYQSRLANDSTYYKFGNPASAFSATSASLITLPSDWKTSNPAFGTTINDPWAQVPVDPSAASTAQKSYYRYEVDISSYANQGIIRLRSTGRVGTITRSIVANLKQTGFIDFLYFTDFETTDPVFSSTYRNNIDPSTGRNVCELHLWQTPSRPSGCGTIQFGSADVLDGPVHSNDTMTICGSTFKGTVSTSNPTTPKYIKPSGCSNAKFKVTSDPSVTKTLDMPQTNAQMKKETQSDLPQDVPRPGCLYTGPTTITFTVVNGQGKMRVWSPYTLKTQTASDNTGTTPSQCGAISDLRSTSGALIDVLNLNLLYVQSVPSDPSDPNYWAPGSTPSGLTCLTSNTGNYSGGWKFGSFQYPVTNEVLPASSSTDTPAYSCRNGDLFVSGQLKGQTTLAADHYIYATGNITYSDSSSDILGLVGQNAVWVWNPIVKSGSNSSYYLSANNREIDAAILSVTHTFQVQNYDGGTAKVGTRGTLTVLGAIAQKFRGTVATTSNGTITNGYVKDYEYDDRFHNTAPPKFLTPVSTTYGVTQYASVKAGFNADGSPAS